MSRASRRSNLGYFVLGAIALVLAAFVFAPAMVGRFVGDLWVTVMGAVMALIAGAFSG
jgi:uncharacterized YccA/Bax inhibitor family protein